MIATLPRRFSQLGEFAMVAPFPLTMHAMWNDLRISPQLAFFGNLKDYKWEAVASVAIFEGVDVR